MTSENTASTSPDQPNASSTAEPGNEPGNELGKTTTRASRTARQKKAGQKSGQKRTQTKKPEAKKNAATATTKAAVARRSGGNRKYDWDSLRQQFVEGFPTNADEPDGARDWPNLRELSERTNVPYERIREWAAKERWTDLRLAHQTELVKARKLKRAETLGKESVEFDTRNLDLAKLGVRLVGSRMTEIARDAQAQAERRRQAEEDMRNGLPVDYSALRSAINSRELETLGKAAQMFQEIGMKALGTDIERMEISGQINHDVQIEQTISVAQELERDDPDRLAAFLAAAQRAGLFSEVTAGELETGELETGELDDSEVHDAELVEEPVEEPGPEPDQSTVAQTQHPTQHPEPQFDQNGRRIRSR